MSPRLAALTARRGALQAEIALQRDDLAEAYADIEQGTARTDRVLLAVRRMGPLIAVLGAAGMLALGPSRALRLLKRGVTVALFTAQARRLLG